jgi:hypothetical protein
LLLFNMKNVHCYIYRGVHCDLLRFISRRYFVDWLRLGKVLSFYIQHGLSISIIDGICAFMVVLLHYLF